MQLCNPCLKMRQHLCGSECKQCALKMSSAQPVLLCISILILYLSVCPSLRCLVRKDSDNPPPPFPKKQKNETGEGEEAERRYEYACDRVLPQSPGWPAAMCQTASIIGLSYRIQQGPCHFCSRYSQF